MPYPERSVYQALAMAEARVAELEAAGLEMVKHRMAHVCLTYAERNELDTRAAIASASVQHQAKIAREEAASAAALRSRIARAVAELESPDETPLGRTRVERALAILKGETT